MSSDNLFSTRKTLKNCRRIVVKIGSSIISREDGNGISLSRIGNIVEQVFEIRNKDTEVIIVSSGAVAIGRHKLQEFKKLTNSDNHKELDKRYVQPQHTV
jgi:glutamate 5-kinase